MISRFAAANASIHPARSAGLLRTASAAFSQASSAAVDSYKSTPSSSSYDAVIVGGGHNGLVAAAYLSRAGKRVLVLERRHLVGGAAISEEIVPGFTFSRCSYVCSLLRPTIIRELDLKKFGLKFYPRNPSSFTPMLDGRYLLMGPDAALNHSEISKFSKKDADAFPVYEDQLNRIVNVLEPLLDSNPPRLDFSGMSTTEKWKNIFDLYKVGRQLTTLQSDLTAFVDLMTAPAVKILDRWFESEPLKSTLATDAVIGAMYSPSSPGSGYVLLHHVMGETDGHRGVWAYVEGGMGSVSRAIARSAVSTGVEIVVGSEVKEILVDEASGKTTGVVTADGHHINSPIVMSNATPHITFEKLMRPGVLPERFSKRIGEIDYNSPVFKMNIAVSRLPNFTCAPTVNNQPGPVHRGTIHLTKDIEEIDKAYQDALCGRPSERPVIEMTIPSSLDPTVAPPGAHVVQLFIQYAPYKVTNGSWSDPAYKNQFVERVLNVIEEFAPGFRSSVIGIDALSPLDLEQTFGLTGGNIFHGALSLDQIFWARPASFGKPYESPIKGLFLCGSGAHPGGGVMGSAGRLAAISALEK